MFQQDYDYLLKILIIGNSSVGKSAILLRYSDNQFHESFQPTIGVDFKIRTFELEKVKLKAQIWDTAGQERFKNITTQYYKGAHGCVLVYDVTNRKSFDDLQSWLDEINKFASPDITKVIIGNKIDLVSSRQVSQDEGMQFAELNQIAFLETSAKAALNIEETFNILSQNILSKLKNYEKNKKNKQEFEKDGINIETTLSAKNQSKKQKSCC